MSASAAAASTRARCSPRCARPKCALGLMLGGGLPDPAVHSRGECAAVRGVAAPGGSRLCTASSPCSGESRSCTVTTDTRRSAPASFSARSSTPLSAPASATEGRSSSLQSSAGAAPPVESTQSPPPPAYPSTSAPGGGSGQPPCSGRRTPCARQTCTKTPGGITSSPTVCAAISRKARKARGGGSAGARALSTSSKRPSEMTPSSPASHSW
ncbi:hypothetical protein T492DRAFT_1054970 [Pavlovales sp. CCMP2436]|nr:hypothetical protein T492DRAFT_1054970 [Pavlovales sp. CCMP2436]